MQVALCLGVDPAVVLRAGAGGPHAVVGRALAVRVCVEHAALREDAALPLFLVVVLIVALVVHVQSGVGGVVVGDPVVRRPQVGRGRCQICGEHFREEKNRQFVLVNKSKCGIFFRLHLQIFTKAKTKLSYLFSIFSGHSA